MNKEEVQSRVSHNGKPLPLEYFDWCENDRVFSSNVDGLVLDFKGISNVTFYTDDNCTFDTGRHCTFNTGWYCVFKTGKHCTFNTGGDCVFRTDHNCIFKTNKRCAFTTNSDCIFKTGDNCIFNTYRDCTFNTGSHCTFNTGSDCTFDTDYDCIFKTSHGCVFDIDESSVIIYKDAHEVISDKREIQLCPNYIKGYLEKIDGVWYLNGDVSLGEHIIADKILSKIVSKKKIDDGIVYKVYNYTYNGMSKIPSYIIEIDGIYSHGDSIRDAKDSIMYKMVDRDTSAYTDMTPDTIYTIPEAIRMYRTITGACSAGVKMFINGIDNVPYTISVKEILRITSGLYGHDVLKEYIDKTK